ncbi:MAG TPA: SdpI family protein [Acholeplasmataceae bacterium]|nr:SdpI family protein [Acholeplasmataceae bacterium]
MWGFRIDPGTALLFLFLIIFIIVTITFPYIKRNELYGIRLSICFESEELWHKIHVNASFGTIPFIVITAICMFLKSAALKTFLSLVIIFLAVVVWTLIAKFTAKSYFKPIREQEEKELKEAIKRESGWR